ncbi:hypothetical protein C8046_00910 [Serinibacter arcticus]|uniref:FHA domain-containing protein n=1 Tax=Serinibacter arcticus TaxID=1655435 RepID=A0A2U1ZR72_9MICO|nr:FHA domain-containing protein [Serinibacter arcticus]PWD49494.1 hypothetical protein C8046_00910 [Serinibacter arcticus]
MALLDSTPARARPFLGEAYRRPRVAGSGGEALRQEAVGTLTATLARPGRLVRQVVALLAVNAGLVVLLRRWLVDAGAGVGVPGGSVTGTLGGVALLLGGLLLAAGPVREGSTTTRALQGWLVGAPTPPTLGALLRPTGVVRLVGCGVLVLGVLASVATTVLGGPPAPTAGQVVAGLVTTVPALVTLALAAVGTRRLAQGRRGHDVRGRGDVAEQAASFAPLDSPAAGAGWVAPSPYPNAAPAPVASPVPPPPPPPSPPVPLVPGAPSPLPATTTERAPRAVVPPPALAPAPAPSQTPSSDLPEHTTVRPVPSPSVPVVVVLDDGQDPRVLGPGRWLVGRAPRAREGEEGLLPLVVTDPGVSKTHALLEVGEHEVTVTDRASSNGTAVVWAAGRRRLHPWEGAVVGPGETVTLGAVAIRVEAVDHRSA